VWHGIRVPATTPAKDATLENVLVPKGPTYATICRFAGLNQKAAPGRLERSHLLSGSQLNGLVEYLDTTPWQKMMKGSVNCPMSEGSIDAVVFNYTDRSQVWLSVDVDGCPFVSNGELTVWGWQVGQRLADWVGADAPI
jgi:hypothetical protein